MCRQASQPQLLSLQVRQAEKSTARRRRRRKKAADDGSGGTGSEDEDDSKEALPVTARPERHCIGFSRTANTADEGAMGKRRMLATATLRRHAASCHPRLNIHFARSEARLCTVAEVGQGRSRRRGGRKDRKADHGDDVLPQSPDEPLDKSQDPVLFDKVVRVERGILTKCGQEKRRPGRRAGAGSRTSPGEGPLSEARRGNSTRFSTSSMRFPPSQGCLSLSSTYEELLV